MASEVYYWKERSCLVEVNTQQADVQYWENLWLENLDVASVRKSAKQSFLVKIIKAHLPQNSWVLEGGTGTGYNVLALQEAGYRATGIDYAEQTIARVHSLFPEIDVRVGNIFHLDFEDHTFDAVFSPGVIEHFWNGYSEIIAESYRVLKPGGFLFISTPTMSLLRKWKAFLHLYPGWKDGKNEPENFFQFVLPPENIIESCSRFSFDYIKKYNMGGWLGTLAIELGITQRKEKLPSGFSLKMQKTRTIDFVKSFFSPLFDPIVSHCALLVFKKRETCPSGVKASETDVRNTETE